MTQFTDEALNDLRRIYKEVFDEEIGIDEARDVGLRLVLLYEALAMPLPHESNGGKATGHDRGSNRDLPLSDQGSGSP